MEVAGMHVALGSLLSGCYRIVRGINELHRSYKYMPTTLASMVATCNITKITLTQVDSILRKGFEIDGYSSAEFLEQFEGIKIGCTITLSLLEKYVTDLLDIDGSDVPLMAQKTLRWEKLRALYNESDTKELLGQLQDHNALLNTILNVLQSDKQESVIDKQDKMIHMMANQEKTLRNIFRARGSYHKYLQGAEAPLDSDCASVFTSTTGGTALTAFDFDLVIMQTAVYRRYAQRHNAKDSLLVSLDDMIIESTQTFTLNAEAPERQLGPEFLQYPPSKAMQTSVRPDGSRVRIPLRKPVPAPPPQITTSSLCASSTTKSVQSPVFSIETKSEHNTDASSFEDASVSLRIDDLKNTDVSTQPPRIPGPSGKAVDDLSQSGSTNVPKIGRSLGEKDTSVCRKAYMTTHNCNSAAEGQNFAVDAKAIDKDKIVLLPECSMLGDQESQASYTRNEQAIRRLSYRNESIVDMAVSSKSVLALASDSMIELWDLSTGEELIKICYSDHYLCDPHQRDSGKCYPLRFSPDGNFLVSCDWFKSTREGPWVPGTSWWNVQTGAKIHKTERAMDVAFSADSSMLACGFTNYRRLRSNRYRIVIFDTATGQKIGEHTGRQADLSFLTFSQDDHRLLAYCWRRKNAGCLDIISVSKVQDLIMCSLIHTWDNTPRCTTTTYDGMVVTKNYRHSGSEIRLFDPLSGREVAQVTWPEYITSLACLPGTREVVFVDNGRSVGTWDPRTGTVKEFPSTLKDSAEGVKRLSLFPDGGTLFIVSSCGTVRLWDLSAQSGTEARVDLLKGRQRPTGNSCLRCPMQRGAGYE